MKKKIKKKYRYNARQIILPTKKYPEGSRTPTSFYSTGPYTQTFYGVISYTTFSYSYRVSSGFNSYFCTKARLTTQHSISPSREETNQPKYMKSCLVFLRNAFKKFYLNFKK